MKIFGMSRLLYKLQTSGECMPFKDGSLLLFSSFFIFLLFFFVYPRLWKLYRAVRQIELRLRYFSSTSPRVLWVSNFGTGRRRCFFAFLAVLRPVSVSLLVSIPSCPFFTLFYWFCIVSLVSN